MAIYIDSAILKEIQSARAMGWVRGVSTNPVLLAKAGGKADQVLAEIARLDVRPLFYQLVSPTLEGMQKELDYAAEIVGAGLVLKVPPTLTGFQFVRQSAEYPCCVTAVYSPAQALIASELHARYVAVYVNRATRLLGDGLKLVSDIAEVLKHNGTEIIAASIKSPEEACAALYAGARHLTLPYNVLTSLGTHPLSEQTMAEFQASGVGILSQQPEEVCANSMTYVKRNHNHE
jgi:transaldolase